MIIPAKLKKGDTVGVVAPSEHLDSDHRKRLSESIQLLAGLGLTVKLPKNIYSNSLGYSASAKEKAEDINQMFADPEVKAVISAVGGNNAFGALQYLDYDLIKANPKICVGFSDATVWLEAIYAKTGLVTYHHGAMVDTAETFPRSFQVGQFVKTLMDGRLGEVDKNSEYRTVRPGRAEGILVGGNLPSLSTLVATEYMPQTAGRIVFLEIYAGSSWFDTAEKYIYQLKYHKFFEGVTGLWVGYYSAETAELKIDRVLLECLSDYSFPILKCDDFGHNCENIVVPIGGEIKLDADKKSVEYIKA